MSYFSVLGCTIYTHETREQDATGWVFAAPGDMLFVNLGIPSDHASFLHSVIILMQF